MRALIHGFTQSPRSFDALLALLGEPALVPALPGHSPEEPADPTAGFLGAVARIASGLEPGSDVLGYSLGGRIALGIAIHHPDRIGRLMLVSSSPGLETEAERDARRQADERWIEMLENEGIDVFTRAWRSQTLFASQASAPPMGHDPHQLALALRQMGLAEMPSLWPRLCEIRIPVVLVTGSLDTKFSAIAERMQGSLQIVKRVEIEGAGHNPILERVEEFLRLMTDR